MVKAVSSRRAACLRGAAGRLIGGAAVALTFVFALDTTGTKAQEVDAAKHFKGKSIR